MALNKRKQIVKYIEDNKESVEKRKSELIELLKRDGIKVVSPVRSALYNAPFSFPLLYRNEVMADILEN